MKDILKNQYLGNDNISGYFLKVAFHLLSRILEVIFNISIETSALPYTWGITGTTQIFNEVN